MISHCRRTLRALFADIQRLQLDPSDVVLCARIQETVLRNVRQVERQVRARRADLVTLRHTVRTKRDRPLTREQARVLKTDMGRAAALIRANQQLLYVLKTVGDSIAFLYVDKWDIKPLALRESAGFISGKAGLRHELAVARWAWRHGIVAILNDLTNCIRYGDITVPRSNGTFLLLELKSSSSSGSRGAKQQQALTKIGEYFESDVASDLFGAVGQFRRVALGSEERHHRVALNALIAEAQATGSAYAEVEEGLVYVCADTSSALECVFRGVLRKCEKGSIVAVVNDASSSESGYFPFTLAITDPDAAIRFWEGRVIIGIVVDPAAIRAGFARRGYDVRIDLESERPLAIYSPTSTHPDGLLRDVGSHYFNWLFVEFLSLDWMISETVRHPIEPVAAEATASGGQDR